MSTKNIIPLIDDSSVSSVNSWSSTKIQAAINENVPDIDLSGKMDSANPTGTGNFSLNRKEGSVIGNYSVAVGDETTASAVASFAEGSGATASGYYSHAEGSYSTASGEAAHAEGGSTKAIGDYSHAEGWATYASGVAAHVEGYNTAAYSEYQHVQGKFNVRDNENKYAHIVGNGGGRDEEGNTIQSNAHTLDWEGNAWYSGDIRVGGTNYDDASTLLTDEHVFETIETLDTLTWDGDTTDKQHFEISSIENVSFYLVSEAVPTISDLSSGFSAITSNGNTVSDCEYNDFDDIIFINSAGIIIAKTDNFSLGVGMADKKGVYFAKFNDSNLYTSSFTINGYTGFPTIEKKIKQEYLPVDEITEEEIHSLFVEIGTFTFNGSDYQFEIGMTWEEFVASDYNTAGLAITGSSLSYGSSTVMYNGSYNGTYATDTIMSGVTYTISNEPA